MLIVAGADVNAQDTEGYTALLRAMQILSIDVVKLLIEAGADVNAQANNGVTALSLMENYWYEELKDYKSKKEYSYEYDEILELLIEAGAKEY